MHTSDPTAVNPATGPGLGPVLGPKLRTDDPLLRAVGETPLLSLRRIVARAGGGFQLWGKAEFLNPTGSVKDRAALAMVRQAIADGALGEGRTLVDASSGNTAVAYAMLGARVGFPVELYLPRNASPERVARIRGYGATVVFTDPLEGTDGAQRAARLRAESDRLHFFYPDQYNNPANPMAHYASTGPEIWRQTEGAVTHLVVGVGTGGTITGTGRFLKERNATIQVVGVQPTGPLHGLEGLKHIPSALRPSTYDERVVDETVRIETEAAEAMRDELAHEEGVAVGVSAGAAVVAALAVGRRAPGSVVVTILPDGGRGAREEAWE